MKKQIFLLVAGVLLIAGAAFAKPVAGQKSRMLVKISKAESPASLVVQLANLENQRTKIGLQDFHGKIWFVQYAAHDNGYARKFNLNGMPDGDYLLFVSNKKGRQRKLFKLKNQAVVIPDDEAAGVSETNAADHFRSVSRSGISVIGRITHEGGSTLGLQLANLQGQPVSLCLMKIGDGALFTENLRGETAFAKKINLDNLQDGDYVLRVKLEDATILQFLNLCEGVIRLELHQRIEETFTSGTDLAKGL